MEADILSGEEALCRKRAAQAAVRRIHCQCGLAALEAFNPKNPRAIDTLRDVGIEVEVMTKRLASELAVAAAELVALVHRRIEGGRYEDGDPI